MINVLVTSILFHNIRVHSVTPIYSKDSHIMHARLMIASICFLQFRPHTMSYMYYKMQLSIIKKRYIKYLLRYIFNFTSSSNARFVVSLTDRLAFVVFNSLLYMMFHMNVATQRTHTRTYWTLPNQVYIEPVKHLHHSHQFCLDVTFIITYFIPGHTCTFYIIITSADLNSVITFINIDTST